MEDFHHNMVDDNEYDDDGEDDRMREPGWVRLRKEISYEFSILRRIFSLVNLLNVL